MISHLRKWLYKQIDAFIKMDAELATQEIKNERQKTCGECQYKVRKKPKPLLPELDVCSICTCIIETKASMISHLRHIDNLDKPLSREELTQYAKDKLKEDLKNYKRVLISCPKNKWKK